MSKPAHRIRLGGLKVTIWRNQSDKGNTWYSATPSRSYKDGEAWKESDSFGFDDLLAMAKLLDLAHSWIIQQNQAEARTQVEENAA
jgi:hypothetical protein